MVLMRAFFLILLIFLATCHASSVNVMTLTQSSSLVSQLQEPNVRWSAWGTNSSNAWVEFKETHVSSALDVREVIVTFIGFSDSSPLPHLSSLRCEESRRVANGFRRGWCSLQSHALHDELTFDYRVAVHKRGSGSPSSAPLLRDETIDGEGKVTVGSVQYAAQEEPGAIIFRFDAGGVSWLPAALRLKRALADDAGQRSRRAKAASTVVERWGYPVAAAAVVYGGIHLFVKLAILLKHDQNNVKQ